jgi:tetratricopeptide (TPR) repeat protein
VEKKILLCILLCGFTAVSPALFADSRMARLYFNEAKALNETGDPAGALELLKSALLFRPDYSDALFLKSRILAEKPENRSSACETARAALKASSWETYTPGEGIVHLCRLLTELRLYKEALFLLADTETGNSAFFSAEEYEILLRCHEGLGEKKNLETSLRSALAAFPDESFFLETFFRTSDPLRAETVRRFDLLKLEPEKHLPAIASYIKSAANSDGVLQLAWDYFRAGGNDPAVSCLLIEKGLVDPQREIERFISFGGLSRIDLLRKIDQTLRFQYPQLVADALSSFSGEAVLDADGDGISEEKFLIKMGKPVIWKIDEDQDGLDEVSVDFSETTLLPSKLTCTTGDSGMIAGYADYPYADEALYYKGGLYPASSSGIADQTFRNHILPGTLALPVISGVLPPVSGGAAWLNYRLDRNFVTLSREKVEAASYMYEERNARESGYTRIVFLEDGKVRQIDIVYSGGNESLVFHRLVFQNGKCSYGWRDLDRDGTFDVREYYDEDGKLDSVAIDTTGDGKPDYFESFFPENITEWDTDGDGILDAREVRSAGDIRYFRSIR